MMLMIWYCKITAIGSEHGCCVSFQLRRSKLRDFSFFGYAAVRVEASNMTERMERSIIAFFYCAMFPLGVQWVGIKDN